MSDEAERERARYEALAALVDGYRRERDEAREQLYMTKRELGRWVDRETKAARERDEARAEVEHAYREGGALYEAKIAEREAFRCGAEAMREACAMLVLTSNAVRGRVDADALRALPIPEEP